jgi:hypothetical protein
VVLPLLFASILGVWLGGCANLASIRYTTVRVNTLYSESIGARDGRFYQFKPVTSGVHEIRLTDMGADLGWELFVNSDLSGRIAEQNEHSDSSDEIGLTPILEAGRWYYLDVEEWSDRSTGFTLYIDSPSGYLEISVDTLYHSQTIDPGSSELYKFRTQRDGIHTVSLTDLDSDLSWALYSNEERTDRIAQQNDFTDSSDEIGISPPLAAGSWYYLEVMEWDGSGGSFDLAVASPVDFTGLAVDTPYPSLSIDAGGTRYFRFQPVRQGAHTIYLTGIGSDLSWELYEDPQLTSRIAQQNDSPSDGDEVAATPQLTFGTFYYLKVQERDDVAGTFDMLVASPVVFENIMVDVLYASQSIDAGGARYYRFQPQEDGAHTVYVTNLGSDLAWELYADPYRIERLARQDGSQSDGDEIGQIPGLTATTWYYLKVLEQDGVSGSFDLEVLPPPDFVEIQVDTIYQDERIYSPEIKLYQFETVESGEHTVALTNVRLADVQWALFSDPGLTLLLAQQNAGGYNSDEVGPTPGLESERYYYLRVTAPTVFIRGFFDLQIESPEAVNTPPSADDQSVSTAEDTPVDVTLTASDPDGDPLTWHIDSRPTNGTLSGSPPDLTYTPDTGFSGDDSFTFYVNDGEADSNTATVSITVNAVGDPPENDD